MLYQVTVPFRGMAVTFTKQKINNLQEKNVFKFILYNLKIISKKQLFNNKLINKIKEKAINTLYKKLKLIIQTYYNKKK